ncbi:hypothetical protein PVAP13_3KG266803 [Panicum virgatum]|uniref:Uncharacterized protein n=1 Tax=Panicum virgatum TaxID=38727 RepID=A0A8T0V0Q2_PANVG|nr:hypothetical protein PVAP13_3KG266803 [Panicum virgatum]
MDSWEDQVRRFMLDEEEVDDELFLVMVPALQLCITHHSILLVQWQEVVTRVDLTKDVYQPEARLHQAEAS